METYNRQLQKNTVFFCNGYLTVYVALSMTVLLSLCLTLIEGARRNAVRMEAEIISEIGMDSILAEYHREMLEQFHLFFIDTSYGTSKPSPALTQEHLLSFVRKNCDMTEVFLGNFLYRDLLGLTAESAAITGIRTASDQNGRVMRKRCVEVVREDIGLTYLEEVRNWLDTVENSGFAERNIEQEKKAVDSQISSYDGAKKQISEEEWVTLEIQNPTQRLESQKSAGILKLVVEDEESISHAGVDLEGLFSDRKQQGMLIEGNAAEEGDTESWIDKLLFQEYVLRYTGRYGKLSEKGLLQYQAEYLITGKDNDTENLKGVVNRISALREAANAAYLFSDETKCAEAEILAAAAASAMLAPEITTLLKITILLAWAYAESLYDVKQLLAGGRVPLIKDSTSWHCDIGCIQQEGVQEASDKGQGLDYEDYLRIFLSLTGTEKVTERMMNIMEMDIRITPGNGNFRIDGCADYVEADIFIKSLYGYDFTITRKRGYEIY